MPARVTTATIGGKRVALAVPTTYMNDSGLAVRALARRFGVEDPADIVVVHDELDLPPGTVRLKSGGGLAGHNGLRSITSHLHSQDYLRVRIGVGKPPSAAQGASHVLRRPPRRCVRRWRSRSRRRRTPSNGSRRTASTPPCCGAIPCRADADDDHLPTDHPATRRRHLGRHPTPAAGGPGAGRVAGRGRRDRRRARGGAGGRGGGVGRLLPAGAPARRDPDGARRGAPGRRRELSAFSRGRGDGRGRGHRRRTARCRRAPARLGDPALRAGQPRDRDDGAPARRAPRGARSRRPAPRPG